MTINTTCYKCGGRTTFGGTVLPEGAEVECLWCADKRVKAAAVELSELRILAGNVCRAYNARHSSQVNLTTSILDLGTKLGYAMDHGDSL